MRHIQLLSCGGPTDAGGALDAKWLAEAQSLLLQLAAAPDKVSRDALIDDNDVVWGRLRDWLLGLSHDKCWYSEARGVFSVLEVEHYRPKKRCKRAAKSAIDDGYWWLAFDWTNYRLCGKVGNAKKGDFFPLAPTSPVAVYNGLSIRNELPLLLDPACSTDPGLLSFDEDGACGPHVGAGAYTRLRVATTVERINLNFGRLKEARRRIWRRCWDTIEECRRLALQMDVAPGVAEAERLNGQTAMLRQMVAPEAEFSAVARTCLLKSGIPWVQNLVGG